MRRSSFASHSVARTNIPRFRPRPLVQSRTRDEWKRLIKGLLLGPVVQRARRKLTGARPERFLSPTPCLIYSAERLHCHASALHQRRAANARRESLQLARSFRGDHRKTRPFVEEPRPLLGGDSGAGYVDNSASRSPSRTLTLPMTAGRPYPLPSHGRGHRFNPCAAHHLKFVTGSKGDGSELIRARASQALYVKINSAWTIKMRAWLTLS
jgi:hypothetical protein